MDSLSKWKNEVTAIIFLSNCQNSVVKTRIIGSNQQGPDVMPFMNDNRIIIKYVQNESEGLYVHLKASGI